MDQAALPLKAVQELDQAALSLEVQGQDQAALPLKAAQELDQAARPLKAARVRDQAALPRGFQESA